MMLILRFWVYANLEALDGADVVAIYPYVSGYMQTRIQLYIRSIYPLRFWVYANRLSLYCPDYSIVRGFSECLQASLFGCIVSRLLIYLCFPFILLPFCVDDAYPTFLGICKLPTEVPLQSACYIPPTFLGI